MVHFVTVDLMYTNMFRDTCINKQLNWISNITLTLIKLKIHVMGVKKKSYFMKSKQCLIALNKNINQHELNTTDSDLSFWLLKRLFVFSTSARHNFSEEKLLKLFLIVHVQCTYRARYLPEVVRGGVPIEVV